MERNGLVYPGCVRVGEALVSSSGLGLLQGSSDYRLTGIFLVLPFLWPAEVPLPLMGFHSHPN